MADEKDTDTSAKAGSESSDEPTLTQLLESWEKGAPKAAKKEEQDDNSDARLAQLEYRLEMKDLIPRVKGDLNIGDKFVETYINMRANEDDRLNELWQSRSTNRGAWDKAIDSLSKEFTDFAEKSGFAKPAVREEKRSNDKGLAAAARMARETKPADSGFDAIDWAELSPTEFEMKKQSYFRSLANRA